MLDVKANFPRKYKRSGLKCVSCEQIRTATTSNLSHLSSPAESQSHIMFDCSAFQELRDKYDLTEDEQIVSFFKEAIFLRDQIIDDDD